MRLPHVQFPIGSRAIHERTGYEGTINGISRKDDKLVYLFECQAFIQWVPSYKLSAIGSEPSAEDKVDGIDEECQYKTFKLTLNDLREAQTVVVGVTLASDLLYEKVFTSSEYERARALYDFLRAQEVVSESFLSMIGLEKVVE